MECSFVLFFLCPLNCTVTESAQMASLFCTRLVTPHGGLSTKCIQLHKATCWVWLNNYSESFVFIWSLLLHNNSSEEGKCVIKSRTLHKCKWSGKSLLFLLCDKRDSFEWKIFIQFSPHHSHFHAPLFIIHLWCNNSLLFVLKSKHSSRRLSLSLSESLQLSLLIHRHP